VESTVKRRVANIIGMNGFKQQVETLIRSATVRARRLQLVGAESISDPEPNHIVLVGHPTQGTKRATTLILVVAVGAYTSWLCPADVWSPRYIGISTLRLPAHRYHDRTPHAVSESSNFVPL
jgi:hypothetical protein